MRKLSTFAGKGLNPLKLTIEEKHPYKIQTTPESTTILQMLLKPCYNELSLRGNQSVFPDII
jgi:hypothetical protein